VTALAEIVGNCAGAKNGNVEALSCASVRTRLAGVRVDLFDLPLSVPWIYCGDRVPQFTLLDVAALAGNLPTWNFLRAFEKCRPTQ
jgi:hypothetical protein